MKTKIQVAILWLFGWRITYYRELYKEPRLIKKGAYLYYYDDGMGQPIFYVHEAWKRQFKKSSRK